MKQIDFLNKQSAEALEIALKNMEWYEISVLAALGGHEDVVSVSTVMASPFVVSVPSEKVIEAIKNLQSLDYLDLSIEGDAIHYKPRLHQLIGYFYATKMLKSTVMGTTVEEFGSTVPVEALAIVKSSPADVFAIVAETIVRLSLTLKESQEESGGDDYEDRISSLEEELDTIKAALTTKGILQRPYAPQVEGVGNPSPYNRHYVPGAILQDHHFGPQMKFLSREAAVNYIWSKLNQAELKILADLVKFRNSLTPLSSIVNSSETGEAASSLIDKGLIAHTGRVNSTGHCGYFVLTGPGEQLMELASAINLV